MSPPPPTAHSYLGSCKAPLSGGVSTGQEWQSPGYLNCQPTPIDALQGQQITPGHSRVHSEGEPTAQISMWRQISFRHRINKKMV